MTDTTYYRYTHPRAAGTGVAHAPADDGGPAPVSGCIVAGTTSRCAGGHDVALRLPRASPFSIRSPLHISCSRAGAPTIDGPCVAG